MIEDSLREVKSLVDEFWRCNWGLGSGKGNKTCLLGLVGYTFYGLDWSARYGALEAHPGTLLADVLAVLSEQVAAEDEDLEALNPSDAIESIYLFNDRHFRVKVDVHNFLDRCLENVKPDAA